MNHNDLIFLFVFIQTVYWKFYHPLVMTYNPNSQGRRETGGTIRANMSAGPSFCTPFPMFFHCLFFNVPGHTIECGVESVVPLTRDVAKAR